MTPRTVVYQASLSFTISWSLLKLMSIESVMPSNQLILYCPLLLLSSIFPSIRVFSNELALHIRWPKYWSFSFSNSPSNVYSGLISFRIWFNLLAVQGAPLKGWQRIKWLYSVTDSMDMSLSNLWEIAKDRKPGVLQSMGMQRFRHKLVTEQQQHTLVMVFLCSFRL